MRARTSGVNLEEVRMRDLVKAVEQSQLRADLPKLDIGDFVKLHLRITEGQRERIQVFDGIIIALSGKGLSETVTVRRMSIGVGIERVIPVNSPTISKIEVVRKGVVRRAKLYYLRERSGKAARVKERLAIKK